MEEERRKLVKSNITTFNISNNEEKEKPPLPKPTSANYWQYYLLILIANILYFFSLIHCDNPSESACWDYMFPKMTGIIIMCSVSSLIFALIYVITIYYKQNYILIPICIINQCLLWNYEDGQTLQVHGGYNRILLLLATILFIVISIIWLTILNIYVRLHRLVKFIIIVLLLSVYCSLFSTF